MRAAEISAVRRRRRRRRFSPRPSHTAAELNQYYPMRPFMHGIISIDVFPCEQSAYPYVTPPFQCETIVFGTYLPRNVENRTKTIYRTRV